MKDRREIEDIWISNFQFCDLVIKNEYKLDTEKAKSLFNGVNDYEYSVSVISYSQLFSSGYEQCNKYFIPKSFLSFKYSVNNLLENDLDEIINKIVPYWEFIGIIIERDKIYKALNLFGAEIRKTLFYATILNSLYFILKSFSRENSENFNIYDPYYDSLSNIYCLSSIQNESFEDDYLIGLDGYFKIGATLVKTFYDEESAIYFLTIAIELGQRLDESYRLRAIANFRLNNFEDAVRDIEKTDMIKYDRDLQYILIESLNKIGNYEQSIQLALIQVNALPNHSSGYYSEIDIYESLADSLTCVGRIDKGLEKLESLIDSHSVYGIFVFLADIYLSENDFEQYVKYIEKAITYRPPWKNDSFVQDVIMEVKKVLKEKQEIQLYSQFEDFINVKKIFI